MKRTTTLCSITLALMVLSSAAEARPGRTEGEDRLERVERRAELRERQAKRRVRARKADRRRAVRTGEARRAIRRAEARAVRRRARPVAVRPGVRAVRHAPGVLVTHRPLRSAATTRRIFVRSRVQDLRLTLGAVDRNRNGVISRRELRRAARRGIALPVALERKVLRNGRATVVSLMAQHRSRLHARFARLDLNGDGFLSRWELRRG